jgi:hypothetical protein
MDKLLEKGIYATGKGKMWHKGGKNCEENPLRI